MSIQTLTKLEARLVKLREIKQAQLDSAKANREKAEQDDKDAIATSEEINDVEQIINELNDDLKSFNEEVIKEREQFKLVLREVENNGLTREEVQAICSKIGFPYEPEAEEEGREEAEAGIARVA